jgi:hypothetical protein
MRKEHGGYYGGRVDDEDWDNDAMSEDDE